MATSQEDVDRLRKEVERLQDKSSHERVKAIERVGDQSREIVKAQLEAEKARLEAEYAIAHQQALVANTKEGAATVLEQVREQRSVAEAQASALDAHDEEGK